MDKTRSALGLVAGLMLLLSSVAHSAMGWTEIQRSLRDTTAPPDLVTGLEIGWKWGGVAMVVCGAIVVSTFLPRWRGRAVSTTHAMFIAIGYVAFGAWALVTSGFDPFFSVFLVPGALLTLAASGGLGAGR